MSERKRKSRVMKRSVSQPDDSTVRKTLPATSKQDVKGDAEKTTPAKQFKFDESTKVEASNVPESQPSVSRQIELEDPITEKGKRRESKSVGFLESKLRYSRTSTASNKDSDSSELGSDKDSSGTTKKDSIEPQNKEKKNIVISSISSDESGPPSVASSEAVLEIDEGSDGRKSTPEVETEETVEENTKRKTRVRSIFDNDDVTSSSSAKSDDTVDTISSLSSF